MELAVCLTPDEARGTQPAAFKKYSRVYIGSSFCQNLLPEPRDLARLKTAGVKAVTIATPLLTGAGLKHVEKLLRTALLSEKELEVSVNDMGLLALIRRHFRGRAIPLLGRPVSRDFARMSLPFLKGFFKYYGVKMLESDEEGLMRVLPAGHGLKIAFHYPYSCLAMSRFCPHEGRMSGACGRACADGGQELKGPGGLALTLKNNAYLIPNSRCRHKSVRRLVYSPPG